MHQIETSGRAKYTLRVENDILEHWKAVASFLRPLTANAAFCEMMNEGARVMVQRVLHEKHVGGTEDACLLALQLGFRVTPAGEVSGPIPVEPVLSEAGEPSFTFAGIAVSVAQLAAVQQHGKGALARGIRYNGNKTR